MKKEVIDHLVSMRHSPLHNYIIPGLTSWMILDNGAAGKIRLFENTREQHFHITPHSHRFNFSCCVIRGHVHNTTWFSCEKGRGDMYRAIDEKYLGRPGEFEKLGEFDSPFVSDTIEYAEGDWYSMKFHEIHSIYFSKNALVLFIEGPSLVTTSLTLEPIVDGEYLPTMETKPWMFRKG